METDQKKPDHYQIDVENKEELAYIASKLGCQVDDILLAIQTLKTRKRSVIYTHIIDQVFKAHMR